MIFFLLIFLEWVVSGDLILGNRPLKEMHKKKTYGRQKNVSEKHASSFLELAIHGM